MNYATIDNQIGSASTLPEGAVEITRDRYKELLAAKNNGKRVTIENGEVTTYTPPVYSPDGTERKERDPSEPLITTAPPDELHVPKWDGKKWTEAETKAQRTEREAQELADARTAAYTRITQGHADALSEIDDRYPLAEKLGWNRLDKSLDKYHAEGAITPGLQLYADQLGVSVEDAAARLDGAIDVYDQAYHDATGKLTRLRDAVDAAETVEELEAAQW